MLSALGKQANSSPALDILKTFDLSEKVKIKRGDNDVHLNNYEKGVSILFKSEEYIRAKYELHLPNDAPMLSAIFLYGYGHDEFSEYSGDLPGNLKFSDGQKQAIEKLGRSDEFDEDFNSEFWTIAPNIRMFVDYSDDKNSIVLIQFGILLT